MKINSTVKSKYENINLLNIDSKWPKIVLKVVLDMEMEICVASAATINKLECAVIFFTCAQ